MLEVELEQWWRGALENSGTKVSIEKTEYACLNASRKCQYAIFELPQVTELKCMGGTYPVEQWRHEYISEQEATVWMKQLEDDSGVPCDMRIPPLVNGKIHKRIVQQAMLYDMKITPMASMKKGQTVRDYVRKEWITSGID